MSLGYISFTAIARQLNFSVAITKAITTNTKKQNKINIKVTAISHVCCKGAPIATNVTFCRCFLDINNGSLLDAINVQIMLRNPIYVYFISLLTFNSITLM